MTQNALTLVQGLSDVHGNGTHSITIGKTTKTLTTEAGLVASASFRKLFLSSLPTQVAFEKATHGNYRAAVEIMGLVVGKAAMNFLQPKEGEQWKKGAVLMLAEKVLEKAAGAKGYSQKQLVVRSLAKAITEQLATRAAAVEEAAKAKALELANQQAGQ